jgi:hypothetical protein
MGGFIFERNQFHQAVFDYCARRSILTECGVRILATNAPLLLPDFSKERILDKSKADGFAKVFVCIQAIWFLVETVGRMASGPPISLLELNTLLHALCCLVVYLAWMSKPAGIKQPHVILSSDGLASKICAWKSVMDSVAMSKISHLDSSQDDANGVAMPILPRLRLAYEDDLAIGYDDEAEQATVEETMIQIARSSECSSQHVRPAKSSQPNHSSQSPLVCTYGRPKLKLYPGQRLYGFVLYDVGVEVDGTVYATSGPAYIECLRLAQELRLEKSEGYAWHFGSADGELYLSYGSSIADYKTRGYKTDQTRLFRTVSDNYVLVTVVLVAGSLYGSIHLIAWNGLFSTEKIQLTWKMSCFIIASSRIAALLFLITEFVTVKTTNNLVSFLLPSTMAGDSLLHHGRYNLIKSYQNTTA